MTHRTTGILYVTDAEAYRIFIPRQLIYLPFWVSLKWEQKFTITNCLYMGSVRIVKNNCFIIGGFHYEKICMFSMRLCS